MAWWRRRILDPVSAPRGASNHQHHLTAIPVPRRDVKTLSLSATLEGRTSLADKSYLITHNSTLDPFPIQTSLQTSLNLWTDQTGKSHHKKSSMRHHGLQQVCWLYYQQKELFFWINHKYFCVSRYFSGVHLRRVITCVAPRPGPLSELSRGSAPIIFFTHPPSRCGVSPPLPSLHQPAPPRKCASLSQLQQ